MGIIRIQCSQLLISAMDMVHQSVSRLNDLGKPQLNTNKSLNFTGNKSQKSF